MIESRCIPMKNHVTRVIRPLLCTSGRIVPDKCIAHSYVIFYIVERGPLVSRKVDTPQVSPSDLWKYTYSRLGKHFARSAPQRMIKVFEKNKL